MKAKSRHSLPQVLALLAVLGGSVFVGSEFTKNGRLHTHVTSFASETAEGGESTSDIYSHGEIDAEGVEADCDFQKSLDSFDSGTTQTCGMSWSVEGEKFTGTATVIVNDDKNIQIQTSLADGETEASAVSETSSKSKLVTLPYSAFSDINNQVRLQFAKAVLRKVKQKNATSADATFKLWNSLLTCETDFAGQTIAQEDRAECIYNLAQGLDKNARAHYLKYLSSSPDAFVKAQAVRIEQLDSMGSLMSAIREMQTNPSVGEGAYRDNSILDYRAPYNATTPTPGRGRNWEPEEFKGYKDLDPSSRPQQPLQPATNAGSTNSGIPQAGAGVSPEDIERGRTGRNR